MKTESNSKVFHVKNATSTIPSAIPFVIAFAILHRTSPYFTIPITRAAIFWISARRVTQSILGVSLYDARGGVNKSSLPARKPRRKDEVLTEPRAQASDAVEREGKDT